MKASHQGFSLLEVLVAFVILSMALGVLLRAFSGGMNNVLAAERYNRALLLAESKLAAVGTELPLEEGLSMGKDESGQDWRIQIQVHFVDGQLQDISGRQSDLYRVDVSVRFGEGDAPRRQIHLTTLKLAK